jgi:hypothetical protein
MGTVVRQEKIGDSSITLSFENYQDFLDYQKKEREQDALDVEEAANRRSDFVVNFFKTPDELPWNKYQLVLSEEEYYYLSCILGHLVPAGEISKSLLDKVGLDDLACEDFDKVVLTCTEIKLVESK